MTNAKILKYTITLHDADGATRFVSIVNKLNGHFDLQAGSFNFDAKSLLGVLSMDPARTLLLTATDADRAQVESALQDYIISAMPQTA